MKVFVSVQSIPIGYTTPAFPSLFWPLGATKPSYEQLFLYFSFDVWRFTVFWSMIFFASLYGVVGVVAGANMLQKRYRVHHIISMESTFSWTPFLVSGLYMVMGVAQGFFSGAIVGLILLAIYRAGDLTMSTWIPFCWGMALILFHICLSYSTSAMSM